MDSEKLNGRLSAIEDRINNLTLEVGKLIGSQRASNNLIKFVILPLIAILAGLVGIKII